MARVSACQVGLAFFGFLVAIAAVLTSITAGFLTLDLQLRSKRVMKKSEIDVQYFGLIKPDPIKLNFDIGMSLQKTGGRKGKFSDFQGDFILGEKDDTPFAQLPVPKFEVTPNNVSVRFVRETDIYDVTQVEALYRSMLVEPTFKIRIKGKPTARLAGTIMRVASKIDKKVDIQGLNNFPGVQLAQFKNDSSTVNATLSFKNESPCELDMLNPSFTMLSSDDKELGTASMEDFIIEVGDNDAPISMAFDQEAIDAALKTRPTCESGKLVVLLQGEEVQDEDGRKIRYMQEGWKAVKMNVTVDVKEAFGLESLPSCS